jgi:hypothetical protein
VSGNPLSFRHRSYAFPALALLLVLIIGLGSLPVTVHAGSSDLTVDSVWLEDASQIGQPISQVAPDQSFNIVATIKNIGQETASGYYLDVYYDGDYGRGDPDNIAPGEAQTWYVGPLTAQAGTHTTTWVADPDTQIAELDETNNQKQLVFTVGSQTVTSNSTSSTTQLTSSSTSSTMESTSTESTSTESTSTTTTTVTSSSTKTSVTASYSVTFYADSGGTITVEGVTKTDEATGVYSVGQRVHVVANPSGGYSFASWEMGGGVSVDDSLSKDTYMIVLGNGWLKAHFRVAFGSTISAVYSSSVTLGFELTANIYDNSGAGYMIAHRSGSNVVFTFNDATRVSPSTHQLTFSDYGNAVLVGGRLANPTVAFYEDHAFASLTAIENSNGTLSIIHEPDGRVALNVASSSLGPESDYFVMESLRDGGHTVIILWGITQYGTLASGVYFDMQFPNLANLSQGSYVIHWQDSDSNGIPDPADTFMVVFNGT